MTTASAHWQNPITVLQTDPAQLEQVTEHGHPLGMRDPLHGEMAGQPMLVEVVDDVVDVVVVVVVDDFEVGAHRRRREVMV